LIWHLIWHLIYWHSQPGVAAMKICMMNFALALSAALASFAAAQNPQPNPKLPNLPANPPAQNGKGQFGQPFNNGQAAANQAAVRAEMMKRFDRDGDGRLNAQEQLAATRAMQERGLNTPGQPNLAGRGGNNGAQTGPGVGQAAPPAPAPKISRREEILMKRFDKDGDGKLNAEEKAAARAELGQKGKTEKK
jgi:hypothetical protein